MNKRLFRLVFSRSLRIFVPAWERARSAGRYRRKSSGSRAGTAAIVLLVAPLSFAAPPLPSGTLPVPVLPIAPGANIAASGTATATIAGRTLTVDQSTLRAIVDWQHFNIASDAAVRFNQPNATAAVLNRIHSADPSVIQGRLTANGDVYLINQNGIVFDRGSQIDTGSLTASTLNIAVDLFQKGLLSNPKAAEQAALTRFDNGLPSGSVVVEAGAYLRSASGGRVLLAGPEVRNGGTIESPDGQVILAAGQKVYLAASQDSRLRGLLVEVDQGGAVRNEVSGALSAARGNVTMVGLAVNQDGRVSATSSVSVNGSIRLVARDTVSALDVQGVKTPRAGRYGTLVLGQGSVTEVRPELGSSDVAPDSQSLVPGRIELAGKSVQVLRDGQVVAPGGSISISAQKGAEFEALGGQPVADVRIYLEAGSLLDASGLRSVSAPMERNQLTVELRGNELRDAPLVRNSPLRGKTVYVDARQGTTLADVSGYAGQITRTVGERTTAGGGIVIKSEGDTIFRDGARIDVSGGSIAYQSGYLRTSKLLTIDGRVIDIGQASPNQLYAGLADSFQRFDPKWGQSVNVHVLARRVTGYVEGKSAGSVTIVSPTAVLDGTFSGAVTKGPYQTTAGKIPLGGRLELGDANVLGESNPDFKFSAVSIGADKAKLAASFGTTDTLSEPFRSTVFLDTDLMRSGGFNRIAVYSDGLVRIKAGNPIVLSAGSYDTNGARQSAAFSLAGRKIDIASDVSVPAGSIVLNSKVTFPVTLDPADYSVTVEPGVTLSTRGLWTNDRSSVLGGAAASSALPDGGVITVISSGNLALGAGSTLDVTAGGQVRADGSFAGGNGGNIVLRSGRAGFSSRDAQPSLVQLDGTMKGYGFSKGGSLEIGASLVSIGGSTTGEARELVLDPGLFRNLGFANFSVDGYDGLTVTSGTHLAPVAQTLVPNASYTTRVSGSNVFDFVQPVLLDVSRRAPANLTLSAKSHGFGALTVEPDASISADPGAKVSLLAGLQLTFQGSINAPGGSVRLALDEPSLSDVFLAGQSLWLAGGSSISVRGTFVPDLSPLGLLTGKLLAGGSVELRAARGYLIAEPTSVIDASGTGAARDVLVLQGGRSVYEGQTNYSAGGSVTLAAQEGIVFDGSIAARGGSPSARGGSLSFALLPAITSNPSFPRTARTVVVADLPPMVPVDLKPRDAVDTNASDSATSTLNHRAFVDVGLVGQSGADNLSLTSPDFIEFRGDAALSLRGRFTADARALVGAAGSSTSITAGYASLASTSGFATPVALAGDATLGISADLIDLEGPVVLQGFAQTVLTSAGDVRLKGFFNPLPPRSPQLTGSLTTTGDLAIGAERIYPTTYSDFTIASTGPTSTVRFVRTGVNSEPLLSAGGSLTILGASIMSNTDIRAPFGQIAISAQKDLVLESGSVTSVSGTGTEVPFGKTQQGGRDWVYVIAPDSLALIAQPRSKQVLLGGPSIDVRQGASLDVSGGGDLLSYEFTAGPGGSVDVLDPANAKGAFAIAPTLGLAFAPYDHQEYASGASTGVAVGQRLKIEGAGIVPDGNYTVLPARYALLPGALLVTPVAQSTVIVGKSTVLADGSVIATGMVGQTVAGGGTLFDGAARNFLIQPAGVVRSRAELDQTLGSNFFAGATGGNPRDAGGLGINPTQTLALNGTLVAAVAPGGLGGRVDLSSSRIAIDAGGGSADDFVHLDVRTLNQLEGQSLLLGGRRETRNGKVYIVPTADTVEIRDGGGESLRSSDLIIAATNRIAFLPGAQVQAAPDTNKTLGDVSIASSSSGAMLAGSIVRVSAAGLGGLTREGTVPANGSATVSVESGAKLAGRSVLLDATGDTLVGAGALLSAREYGFAASRISVGTVSGTPGGLILSGDRLAQVQGAERLLLRSYSTVDFYGSVSLGASASDGAATLRQLVLDTGLLRGFGAASDRVDLRSGAFRFVNTSGVASGAPIAGPVQLLIEADRIDIGAGTKAVTGFSSMEMNSSGTLALSGTGQLRSAADITIRSGAVTVTPGSSQAVESIGGTLSVLKGIGAQAPAMDSAAGSALLLSGARVVLSGQIQAPGSAITLEATGTQSTDGILLDDGARIVARGFSRSFGDVSALEPGGQVTLRASSGSLKVSSTASIDVAAAASGGDAGSVVVETPGGSVEFAGALLGSADPDRAAGRFSVDALRIDQPAVLNGLLEVGGFHGLREYRVRSGSFTVGAGETITAKRVVINVDAGDLSLLGRLDASGPKGGAIEAFARDAVSVGSNALLTAAASAPGANGGSITLGSRVGSVQADAGAILNVGSGAGGQGGTVLVRAPRNDGATDVNVGGLGATVVGAREIVIEAVRVYEGVSIIGQSQGAGRLSFSQVDIDNTAFMSNASNVLSRLGLSQDPRVHLRPGVEVRSDGNLTLESDWNLFTDNRPGGEPGYLTLRSAGNLDLKGALSDAFTTVPSDPTYPTSATDWELRSGDSWSIRLTSGADVGAASPKATRPLASLDTEGRGDLVVRSLVRTGTGFVEMSAGRDFRLANAGAKVYTAGVADPGATVAADQLFYEPEFEARAAQLGLSPDSTIVAENPVYLTGGGDISIRAGRDAIGQRSTQLVTDWLYKRAFGVPLESGRFDYVNPQTAWWPRIRVFDQGIGALGGGNVILSSGRDMVDLSASVATSGRLEGALNDKPVASNLIVTGGGDLLVEAGRDVVRGQYFVAKGVGAISAGRDVTSSTSGATNLSAMVLALADSRFSVTAGRSAQLQTAMNPTLITQVFTDFFQGRAVDQAARFITYSEDASVTLTALSGKAQVLSGTRDVLGKSAPQLFGSEGRDNTDGLFLYPGSLRIVSMLSDIETQGVVRMVPARGGNLEMLAGGSVSIQGEVNMLDNSPAVIPGVTTVDYRFSESTLLAVGRTDAGFIQHSDPPLHAGDVAPARIVALAGNVVAIGGGTLTLPKPVRVLAGQDVLDFSFYGQNLRESDLTAIVAGRDVRFSTQRQPSGFPIANANGIRLGGPGTLEVVAGDDIDLAASAGLTTRGNLDNPFLPEGGARIVASAGLPVFGNRVVMPEYRTLYVETGVDTYLRASGVVDPGQRAQLAAARRVALEAEFESLGVEKQAQASREVFFSELRSSGREASSTRDYSRGFTAITRLFPQQDGADRSLDYGGGINMFFSQIKTESGGDIQMFAPGGIVNAGLANTGEFRKDASQLGVITVAGGSIRSFSRGDFLVNASRVFTLGGGDIMIWSSEGNIDAGKGAKTTASTPPPQLKVDRDGKFTLDITQSIQGSGIAVLLGKENVTPGDVDLIAPKGEVNAGDAGIRVAGNLNIAALRVVGADNIRVGGVSVGVPAVQTTSLAAGLTGVSTSSDAARATEQVSQQVSQSAATQTIVPSTSFVTVEVISLGDEDDQRKRER